MKNAPRYCTITNEPMFEGWYFEGLGFFYAKYEKDALRICQEHDYDTLDEAFEDEFMYWTDWHDIPKSEWDEAPKVH